MILSEVNSFRDLDRKIIKISKLDEVLKNNLNINHLKEPLYGITYIDEQSGLTLRILGDDNTQLDDQIILVRADMFEGIEYEYIDGSKEMIDILKNQIEENYYDERFISLLSDEKLDDFRHSHFINDVRVLLISEKGTEEMWARLFVKSDEENLYFGELLNNSFEDSKYSAGTSVGIVYVEKEDKKALLIDGVVKFEE